MRLLDFYRQKPDRWYVDYCSCHIRIDTGFFFSDPLQNISFEIPPQPPLLFCFARIFVWSINCQCGTVAECKLSTIKEGQNDENLHQSCVKGNLKFKN